jgi:hypothetical protein
VRVGVRVRSCQVELLVCLLSASHATCCAPLHLLAKQVVQCYVQSMVDSVETVLLSEGTLDDPLGESPYSIHTPICMLIVYV